MSNAFSNHIPRSGLPTFNESSDLRSPRDSDSIGKAWQKNRMTGRRQTALSNSMSQMHKAVSSIRQRVLSPSSYRPFFIYNVNPGLLLPKGTVRTDPFNHGRLPTVDDAWRTFQVRGGLVGCRPTFLTTPLIGSGTINNEFQISVFGDGADGCVGLLNNDWYSDTQIQDSVAGHNLSFLLETINIPNVGDVTATAPVVNGALPHAVRWVLNSDLDEFFSINASFWIEITDDDPVSFPKAKIKARMWTGQTNDKTGRAEKPFPDNGNIIPLGTVSPRQGIYVGTGDAFDLVPSNDLSGHIINRYGPGPIGSQTTSPIHNPATGPRYLRGFYYPDEDPPFNDPDGLLNTVWYPGDSVSIWTTELYITDATFSGGSPDSVTLNVTKEYMYFGDPGHVTEIPDFRMTQIAGIQPQA